MVVTKTISNDDQHMKNASRQNGWRMTGSSGRRSIASEATKGKTARPASTWRCGRCEVTAQYASRYVQQNTLSATPARTLRSRNDTPVGSEGLDTTRVNRPQRAFPDPASARHIVATLSKAMKTEIHPEYVEAHVRCTCGNEFTTRSTQSDIHVEICSNCHPFYTGRQKLVDTGGRVERFQRRAAKRRAGASA